MPLISGIDLSPLVAILLLQARPDVPVSDWLRIAADGRITLTLHIQPGAKKTEFAGLHGDALKIRLAAPPVDGKANEALIKFVADTLASCRNRRSPSRAARPPDARCSKSSVATPDRLPHWQRISRLRNFMANA